MLLPEDWHEHVFKMAHLFNLVGANRRWVIPNLNISLYRKPDHVPKQIISFDLVKRSKEQRTTENVEDDVDKKAKISLVGVASEMYALHQLHR